jgi:hypothetical protein
MEIVYFLEQNKNETSSSWTFQPRSINPISVYNLKSQYKTHLTWEKT